MINRKEPDVQARYYEVEGHKENPLHISAPTLPNSTCILVRTNEVFKENPANKKNKHKKNRRESLQLNLYVLANKNPAHIVTLFRFKTFLRLKTETIMKNCLHCNTEFKGRINRKFCSTKCKNAFHNENNREKESIVRNLNRSLHKNWIILQDLYRVYKSTPINIGILESNGFKTKYHTHVHNSPVGEKYTMVYDYGFKNYFDNQVQIVKE